MQVRIENLRGNTCGGRIKNYKNITAKETQTNGL